MKAEEAERVHTFRFRKQRFQTDVAGRLTLTGKTSSFSGASFMLFNYFCIKRVQYSSVNHNKQHTWGFGDDGKTHNLTMMDKTHAAVRRPSSSVREFKPFLNLCSLTGST